MTAVYDDNRKLWGKSLLGVPIRGPMAEVERLAGARAVVAIGDNRTREKLASHLPLRWTTAIHPSSTIHPSAQIGEGTVICAGAVIQPDAEFGAHCIVNTASSVDHDCNIGDFVHIAPGTHLAGHVTIHRSAFLGIGVTAIPGVQVGENTVVGAGAVVIQDLPAEVVAVGIPARVVKPRARLRVAS